MSIKHLVFGILFFSLFSCQQEGESEVSITLQVENLDTELQYIVRTNSNTAIEPAYKFKLTPEMNSHTFSLPFDKGKMFSITEGLDRMFYLDPGNQLTVLVSNDEQGNQVYEYSGSGAIYQHLLDQFKEVEDNSTDEYKDLERGRYSLLWPEYVQSLKQVKEQKNSIMSAENGVSISFKELMKAHFWAKEASNKLSYVARARGTALIDQVNMDEIDSIYVEVSKFDASALGSISFASLLSRYSIEKIQQLLRNPDENDKRTDGEKYRDIYTEIDSDPLMSDPFKVHALSFYLQLISELYGIELGLELKDMFLESYPSFEEASVIKEQFSKWDAISPGKPAIDFTYENVKGEVKSLSDYFGNVIYVDIWATWCGPCIAEFPSSADLKARFADADDVVFMYVSIDEDNKKDRWKADLVKHGLTEGVNLFAGKGFESTIAKAYLIKGIPRYMLIDKEGNIHSSQAPRPSSGDEIFNEIQKLRGVSLDSELSMN